MGSLNPENTSKQDLDDSGYVQDASVTESSYKGLAQLLDLSDDVLLYILKYCTPRDLKALGHTCPRLGALVCDRTLWTRVDARSTPVGQLRLRWLLKHCLSPATTELKLAGYANTNSRCLGIQDLHWPLEADSGVLRGTYVGSPGVDVDHFLLRMWYPHLPRFAVTPRWPDKEEADSKAPQKASEATTSNSGESSSSSASNSGSSASNSGNSTSNSGNEASHSGNLASDSGNSTSNSGNSTSNSGNSTSNSGNSTSNSGNVASDSGNSSNSGSKKETKKGFPIVFEDSCRHNCKGPQFTLTAHLMKDLRKKCSHLTSLALEYCNIDYKTTSIRQFPRNLKKLSLRGTRCYNLPLNTSYLGKITERLPELEYLNVSECDWFEPASLMPLSKLPSLEQLYMRDCKRLTECVAYASLAARYGFKKLKVIDVRGSPLADSEISAMGWLPLLEELYCAPPKDMQSPAEHTHSWSDTTAPFTELDTWEIEEPDYYRVKTPEPDATDDDDDQKDEPDTADVPERPGDVLLGNPWWSHERRIIVIQPNANREFEQRRPRAADLAPQRAPIAAQIAPVVQQVPIAQQFAVMAQRVVAQAAPAPQRVIIGPGAVVAPEGPQVAPEPQVAPVGPQVTPQPPAAHQQCRDKALGAVRSLRKLMGLDCKAVADQAGPADPQVGPTDTQAGPVDPQLGPTVPQGECGEAGPSKRRANPENPLDLAKRPRLDDDNDDDDDEDMPGPPITFPMAAEQCPRLRERGLAPDPPNDQQNRSRCLRIRQNDANPVMHIDVDVQRQSTIHLDGHIGYHLVSDSAILRFGRAENDNINYIHIGRNGIQAGIEPGMRPDRSNLRILSITGYRNITDRSLQHLATAAPHLISIDFSETNVSARGVAIFKAHRPNCKVIYSKFGRTNLNIF